MGQPPNCSKQSSLPFARAGAAVLLIPEYGTMMLRIIDTESRQFSYVH